MRRIRLTFRAKLVLVVAIFTFACVLSIATDVAVARQVESQLTAIRARYLPKVELGPELKGQFDTLRRAFQDSVASRDLDMLGATGEIRRRFVGSLEAARPAVDPVAADALNQAFDAYYGRAADVSRRIIAGETGETLVDDMAAMQASQQRVSALIVEIAAFDQAELDQTLASIAKAESRATAYEVWISIGSLIAVFAISVGLIRGLLGSFSALIDGFGRFGNGDFRRPIAVVTEDELANVARHANRMAANLDALAQERDRAEAALKLSNRELEAFSYSVAHDLRAPLRAINGFSRALAEDCGERVGAEGLEHLERIAGAAQRMGDLIDGLLTLSRVSRADLRQEPVDLTDVARAVMKQLQISQPERSVEFVTDGSATVTGDPRLLRAVLENLLGNAWKFTAKKTGATIAFGTEPRADGVVHYVRDNGAGFDAAYANKLFVPFQRLHRADDFAGIGIGLATVQRIVQRHGGRVWAEGIEGSGATFFFTLATQSREGS